ncbi:MAG TPA: polynucleotide adenylyltransferase PcnB [Thermoanaerobaculia bacterium]|nr:polynucleotide adenylyltransferase PcnB [Thermoanaerobaculia bacterium]
MTEPRIIPRAEHSISRGYIDPDALKVLYRLHRSGFKAYLVGGSVRDLLTGRTPKDFDIGTDARPQDVRRLFRNCRVIGRRFRLAHVLFDGGKIVEVSTFRRRPEPEEAEQGQTGDVDLLIRSDNTFGTPAEDAVRRDFTINGLFYDISNFAVIDYVGGVEDLERHLVRTIGEPEIRFREDPVRMMRACEFAARLGFEMSSAVRAAIDENRREIRKSAAPRVTEELLDPLRRGWGAATYRLWSETGLLGEIFPDLEREVGGKAGANGLFWKMLAETDRRRAGGEVLSDASLLGVVFLPLLFSAIRERSGGRVDAQKLLLLLEEVVNPSSIRLSLPNAAIHDLKQGLFTMGRLAELGPGDAAARRLVTKGYFPVAVGLLSLYAAASGRYRDAALTWEEVLRRGGRTPRPGEDIRAAIPFPEALVPHETHDPHEVFLPDDVRPAGRPAHRRRRRRSSGSGGSGAAA